jgi:hypothetical protein
MNMTSQPTTLFCKAYNPAAAKYPALCIPPPKIYELCGTFYGLLIAWPNWYLRTQTLTKNRNESKHGAKIV